MMPTNGLVFGWAKIPGFAVTMVDRNRRRHDHLTAVAFRADIGVDAGGIAEFPWDLRVHHGRGDHHQRRNDAVEIDLGTTEFVGQRILVRIGRGGMVREIGARH